MRNIRVFQITIIIFNIILSLVLFKLHLTQTANTAVFDFQLQNFIELNSGDTFMLARRLNSLSVAKHWDCIQAYKKNIIFFEDSKKSCSKRILNIQKIISTENNSDVKIIFFVSLPPILQYSFFGYLLIQILLVASILVSGNKLTKLKLAYENNLFNLSRELAHDIRSPLAVLQTLIPKESDATILQAIDRIKSISNSLLDKINPNRFVDANKIVDDSLNWLEEIVNEKKIEILNESKTISFTTNFDQYLNPPYPKHELQRIVSNVINNSIDAIALSGSIYISTKILNENLVISVKDTGKGIPKDILLKFETEFASFSKSNGNGLALESARKKIQSWNGVLVISSEPQNGTEVTISLPLKNNNKFKNYLIDDDPIIRKLWEKSAEKNNISLKTFAGFQDFEAEHITPTDSSILYIDVNLSRINEGYSIAAKLHEAGFTEIYFCTGLEIPTEELPVFIKGSIGKQPPWIHQ